MLISFTCSMPSSRMSPTNSCCPVTRSWPPTLRADMPVRSPSTGRPPGRGQYRGHDALIPSAPAQVTGQPLPHVGLGGPGVLREQGVSRHHHARDAETALDRAFGQEGVLEHAEPSAILQTLDGDHPGLVHFDREAAPSVHRPAVPPRPPPPPPPP